MNYNEWKEMEARIKYIATEGLKGLLFGGWFLAVIFCGAHGYYW